MARSHRQLRLKGFPMYFIIWQSNNNSNWYWRLMSANHKTIADGAEGYVNKSDCLYGVGLVMDTNRSTPIYER
jgi:uncharacterized protein YegP (UPF0339 family)